MKQKLYKNNSICIFYIINKVLKIQVLIFGTHYMNRNKNYNLRNKYL